MVCGVTMGITWNTRNRVARTTPKAAVGGDPGQDYQQTTMKQGAKVDTQLARAAKDLPSHSRQHRFHVYVC